MTSFTRKIQAPVTYVAAVDAPKSAIAEAKLSGGYLCDGTADQTEINAAITAVAAAGGAIVHLSSGTFTLTGPIIVEDAITLEGEGWQSAGSGTRVVLANGANCNAVEPKVGTTNAYIRITAMHIDGNRTNQTATSYGIADTATALFGADLKIRDCLINHCRDCCVRIANSPTLRHFELYDSTLEYVDAGGYCLYLSVSDDKGHKLFVSKVDFETTTGDAVYIDGFESATGDRGYSVFADNVVKQGGCAFIDCKALSCTGNSMYGPVLFTGSDKLQFTGNSITQSDCILDTCDDVTITGNHIVGKLEANNTDASGNNRWTITGNVLGSYVDLDTVLDGVMTGNTVFNYVQPRHCQRLTISNNHLGHSASATYAVYMNADDSDYLTIAFNDRVQTDGGLSALTLGTTGTHNTVIDACVGVFDIRGTIHFGTTENVATPAVGNSNTVTINLGAENHHTLDCATSATGAVTANLTVPPGPCAGSIVVKLGSVDITWTPSAGTARWHGTEPTWDTVGDDGKWITVSWRWDTTNLFLSATDTTA